MWHSLLFSDGPNGDSVLGSLDLAFLFAYAVGMFGRYDVIAAAADQQAFIHIRYFTIESQLA